MRLESGGKSPATKRWEKAMYAFSSLAALSLLFYFGTTGAVPENITRITGYVTLGFCALSLGCMTGAFFTGMGKGK